MNFQEMVRQLDTEIDVKLLVGQEGTTENLVYHELNLENFQ